MTTIDKNQTVIWQPNPGQQTVALQRNEREILYGGARGGGKSDAAIAKPLYHIDHPEFRFLVIRRNSKDLDDWIDRAKQMWINTGADFVQGEVRFPSGAKGRFGHLHDDDAYEKYQGHEYQLIIIEELTHIPSEELYLKLIGSCRSTVEGIKPQIFMTTNPGNAGHLWVRQRFVDVSKPNERFYDAQGNTRIFIPARVEDNPVLTKSDPTYVKWLDSLPEALRKAWRDGSWDDVEVEGSYYSKWVREARENNRILKIPYEKRAPVHTWWDLGIGDSMAIVFFQNIGMEWRVIDCLEGEGEGLDYYIKILTEKEYIYGDHFAPHDIQVRELSTGKSRLEIARSLGINFRITPNLGIDDGIQALRTRFNQLWFDEEKCNKLLDALMNYHKEFDEKHGVWKNKPVHDWSSHFSDCMRYWAVSREKIGQDQSSMSEQRRKQLRRSKFSAIVR